ncbi:MAG: hypothetical protein KKA67_09140 [Spirochaetes bacterium]|nr:hypothetical protein [Spirochaetota bacterium]MBU1080027.1 hypothetical protein [Spirochaetota bacterium]
MKAIKGASIALHLLVGVGGLAGGLAAVSDPVSPLGVPTEMLKNSPFSDYLIPGIVLMAVIGMGNLVAGFLAISRFKHSGLTSGAMGAVLVGWIVIQCFMLRTVAALHVIFFFIGAAQGLLALALLYLRDSFPFSLLKKPPRRA